MRDDLVAADTHLRRALTLDRKHRDARALLAEACYRRDDLDGAAALYEAGGRRAMAGKLRSFAGRRPYSLEGPALVRLPFVRREPLPIVTARVNGGEDARFLLDTGGGEMILDSAFAGRAGVRRFGRESDYFGGGKTGAFEHGAVDAVGLGDLTVRDVPVITLDLRQMGAALGEPELAGILGTVLFYRLRATLDYPAGQLVLRRKDAPPDAGGPAVEVPFRMAGDHFMVAEGTLNGGPPLMLFIDTGLGGGAFTCPPSTLKAAGIDLRSVPRGQGVVAGGSLEAQPFDVAALTLGGARRERLQGIAGPFPPQLEWEFGFRIGGLISHECFLPYAVTFDFTRMVVRLVPGAPSP